MLLFYITIAYFIHEKRNADEQIKNYEDTMSKYAQMIEQLKNEGKMEKEKLNNNNATFMQQKMVEDELRGNIEKLQFKLRESDNTLRSQSEEYYNIKAENQNLQADLKNLITIEQALRAELNKLGQK